MQQYLAALYNVSSSFQRSFPSQKYVNFYNSCYIISFLIDFWIASSQSHGKCPTKALVFRWVRNVALQQYHQISFNSDIMSSKVRQELQRQALLFSNAMSVTINKIITICCTSGNILAIKQRNFNFFKYYFVLGKWVQNLAGCIDHLRFIEFYTINLTTRPLIRISICFFVC